MKIWKKMGIAASFVGAVPVGCGGAPGESGPADPAPPELSSTSEALSPADQTNCGAVAPDATVTSGSVTSPTATYDHPTCRNSFVADFPTLRDSKLDVGSSVNVSMPDALPFWDTLFCAWNWVESSLWQKQGTTFVRVSQQTQYAQWTTTPQGTQYCRVPIIMFSPPATGEYKVVASAGLLLGPEKRVSISYLEPYGTACAPVFGQACSFEVAPTCTSGIVDPLIAGTTGCYESTVAGSSQTGCVPNSVPDQTAAQPCLYCGHHPGASTPFDCGACEAETCNADVDCAPGLVCDPAKKLCELPANCTLKQGFCWKPLSSSGDYGVTRLSACQ